MQDLLQDLRYAIRTLWRNPTFAAITVVTLALGIGANTAVFSVINSVLLRPLPYEEADRLTLIWTNFGQDLPQNWISGPEYAELQEFNKTFDAIGVTLPFTVTVTGDGEPEQVPAAAVSGNMFDVLRVRPQLGRPIGANDDRAGATPVAVLGDGFWRRRFGADPRMIGRTVIINGNAVEVVGVLPPGFRIMHPDAGFPERIDVWTALLPVYGAFVGGQPTYSDLPRGSHGMRGFGRMKTGVALEQAQADLDAVAIAMQERTPDYYDFEGWGITVYSMLGDLVEDVRPALLVLFGAVGFVLLIACVNVANLMLARAAGREREMAVRTAVGAGRGRLVRQLLTESVVLATAGGIFGFVIAFAALRLLVAVAPEDLPRVADIGIDPWVLTFTIGVSVGTGLLFGLAPALHTARSNFAESFKEGGRGSTTGARGRRVRTVLVVAEVALALVLLVGAGLLMRSFRQILQTDPGYRTDQMLTMRISLPFTRYNGSDAAAFWLRLINETTTIPGVQIAGAISQLPLSGSYSSGTTGVERSETLPEDQRFWEVDRRQVTPGYFEVMGAPLVSGRFFTDADRDDAPLVAIVDEQFVRRAWPSEDPIGQRISISTDGNGNRIWREVVGVVRHQKHYGLNRVGREQAYFPVAQAPTGTMFLAVRTPSEPLTLASTIRNRIWTIDPDQPVADVQSMEQRVTQSVAAPRFNLLLLTTFAAIALVLAAVGIYGVIAYAVAQRSHEIGVRIALGAESRDVVRMILGQGVGLVVTGLGIGTVAALALTRVMRSLLFEVSATDPLTFLAVGVVLALVGAAASLIPARRATRVEPMNVLTTE